MADIELVIKIPEEEYRKICILSKDGIGMALYDWIANGTPLPKGHKRLIYEPTKEEIEKTIGGQSDFTECIRDSVKAVFDNAPTIIGADNEE